jgi:hypothetical protein
METNIALIGGKSVSVKFKMDGRTDTVQVRELNVDELPKFAALQDSECAMIELCADKPDGWAKTVTRDSHAELMKAIDEVNGSFFQDWADRMQKREERLMPGITARKLEALTRTMSQVVAPKK